MATAYPTSPNFPGMRNRMSFNVRDWYWRVAGVEGRIYSSKLGASVAADDAALADWQAQGGRITNIANIDELNEVLVQRGVAAVPADDPLVGLVDTALNAPAP